MEESMNIKYTGVKGTRDFIGKDLRKRNYLLNILKYCFESFNFQELQTPSFEKLETFSGIVGEIPRKIDQNRYKTLYRFVENNEVE